MAITDWGRCKNTAIATNTAVPTNAGHEVYHGDRFGPVQLRLRSL